MTKTFAQGAQAPGYYRFRLGRFGVVALHDGIVSRDRPPGFIRNAADDVVGEAFAAAGMPRDKLTLTFTALAVETDGGVVLIDAGMGEAGPAGTGLLASNLAAAGIAADEVTEILISHFHGDHISGLRRKDGSLTFPKARIHVPQVEWDYWMDDDRMAAVPEGQKANFNLARRIFSSDTVNVDRFAWGEEVLPGITALQASGHTPGMTVFDIASDGTIMTFAADITNNPLLFARHPEWQAAFDMAPDEAVATRRRLLDQAAAEKRLLAFFHAPFPGLGFVVKNAVGYEFLPALWGAS